MEKLPYNYVTKMAFWVLERVKCAGGQLHFFIRVLVFLIIYICKDPISDHALHDNDQ